MASLGSLPIATACLLLQSYSVGHVKGLSIALPKRVVFFCPHFVVTCPLVDNFQTTSNAKDIKMTESSLEVALSINIDTKRSSTAVVREALYQATSEKKWIVNDDWAYFLVRKVLGLSFMILIQNY